MIVEAFGQKKDVMDWLSDSRVHPEVTRDVLVKRWKRGWNGEECLTVPIAKGAAVGDTKQRIKAREDKMKMRVKFFKLAQTVRSQYDNGIAVEEIMDRYGLSKSQVLKMGAKLEYFNIHWSGGRTPEQYKQYLPEKKESSEE